MLLAVLWPIGKVIEVVANLKDSTAGGLISCISG